MSNHTPAPWTVREVTGLSIPGQRAFAIDFNEDQEQVVDWVYEEADAHLIAAAPDLLEALEFIAREANDPVIKAFCIESHLSRPR